jgi:hypothetical protein
LKLGENPSGKTANAHTGRSGGGSDGPQQD